LRAYVVSGPITSFCWRGDPAPGARSAESRLFVGCFHHSSDWHNDEGIIRQADAQGMGIVLMRPLTSGVFQRLMARTFPQVDVLDVGKLLLNYVLSDPYVDVALIGMREPRFVDLNNAISDDVSSRLELAQVHERYVR
jgi:hypothetical protein